MLADAWIKKYSLKQKREGSFCRNHAKCVLPPTTEKVMHVFLSSYSTDFVLIDFRLLDYLWQSLNHLDVTNSFIDETIWAPLSIQILSGVIWFLLPFNFHWIFSLREFLSQLFTQTPAGDIASNSAKVLRIPRYAKLHVHLHSQSYFPVSLSSWKTSCDIKSVRGPSNIII